jgi:tRNA 2-(methylsulfanyl)-N6-isopentenyladenosine37 hydroxylase
MLGLKVPTNPEWVTVAVENIPAILSDHAHCEKKAAMFAMNMITRYPERSRLVSDMIELAQEEVEHFELVHKHILSRSEKLRHDKGGSYARQLHALISKNEPQKLLDSLIVGAIIEARSCERFSILAKHISDSSLAEFYTSLLASEAGHYRAYTDIAREYYPATLVKKRLKELLEFEAVIISSLDNKPLMHG